MSAAQDSAHVFEQAAVFVSEMWGHYGPRSEMHVGDLAWGTFSRWPSKLSALRLWSDEAAQIQALTMFDGAGVCDLLVRPGPSGLTAASQALDWAESRFRADGSMSHELRVGRRVQSSSIIELLRTRGFERLPASVPAMSRSISSANLAPASIAPGYVVRELTDDDLSSRVLAFNAAFPGDELCIEAYQRLRGCSLYDQRLDIVAFSQKSTVASFATLWLDKANGVVQIEPAGCHPDHRRRGLTRAVILRALHSAVSLGATAALVRHVNTNTAAKALYESCGFSTACTDTGFAKTLPPGAAQAAK